MFLAPTTTELNPQAVARAIGRVAHRYLVIAICACAPFAARAGDWPQILGPHRNGIADGEELVAWPAAGPEVLWEKPVGNGFSGVAVAGKRVILFHRLEGKLVAESLDATTGKSDWATRFETDYRSTISSDDGPRCVPIVDRGRVYLLGPGGELACLDLATGKKFWSRAILREFNAPEGYFGVGSSPLVEGDNLLLNIGGAGGAGLVAVSLTDGQTRWKSTNEAASYSSPVAVTIDGVRHVIFVTRLNVVSIDPSDGSVRFRFAFGARGPTVNAANPLVLDHHLFVTASYGVGAQWSKISARQATKIWESGDVMSSQYSTCVQHGGYLYGIDGRQDVGQARLRCFDPNTAKVHWTEEDFGTGNLILAQDKLLILTTAGTLVLAEASPKAFRPLAKSAVFDTTTQALAALSQGRLYARDTKTLKCLVVGKPAKD